MRPTIGDLRATTVTVPLEAPLRHSNGAHWGRFVSTIVEVETTDGIVGLGELGGVGVHSSGELGIQLATMLHLGAVLAGSQYAADAHYHHLTDDVIAGGKLEYRDGTIAVPDGPGLGVTLDRDRLAEFAELYERLGNHPYDRDPGRPEWFALVPNENFAHPPRP